MSRLLDRRQRLERRVGLDARGQRVLLRLVGEELLAGLRQQVREQLLRLGLLLRALDHRAAGDVDERARIAARREVDVDRVVGALLGDRLGDVVVVDEPDLDLAVGDRVADGDVVLERLGVVGDHALEPRLGLVLAAELAQRGHERLERRVGRRPADAALPLRLDKVKDGLREVGRLELALVERDDARSRGQADPLALGRAVARVDLVEDRLRERGEAPLLLQRAERARVLAEEDVGGAVVALLEQRAARSAESPYRMSRSLPVSSWYCSSSLPTSSSLRPE